MISSSISISTSEILKLEKHIRMTVLTDLQEKLRRAVPNIQLSLQEEIRHRVSESDLLTEMQNGRLRYDLGLTMEEVSSMAGIIPDVVSKATNVRVRVTRDSIDVVVEMISRGYEDLLALPQAEYISKGGHSVTWLEWLLTKGDTIVIGEFRVKYVDNKPYSRSGGAIMVKGSGFRIAPEFSGTPEDNFLTRSLNGIDGFIYKEIVKYL